MKHIFSVLLIIFCFQGQQVFSQDSLVAKYDGECLISGGSITVAEFKKLHSLCPPKLTKVIRFKFIYQAKGTHRKNAYPTYYEGNLDFQSTATKAKAGDIIIFDEIIGLGPDKKRANADGMVLLLK